MKGISMMQELEIWVRRDLTLLDKDAKFLDRRATQSKEIDFSNGLWVNVLCFFSRQFRIFQFFRRGERNTLQLEC
jgi:hypothetical protein